MSIHEESKYDIGCDECDAYLDPFDNEHEEAARREAYKEGWFIDGYSEDQDYIPKDHDHVCPDCVKKLKEEHEAAKEPDEFAPHPQCEGQEVIPV